MEYRVLGRMTGHKDHVSNLFVRSHSKFNNANRHKEVLPFKHNRIKLQENPIIEDEEETDEYELNRYFNANYINSNVYSCGPAFIASQSPNTHSISNFW